MTITFSYSRYTLKNIQPFSSTFIACYRIQIQINAQRWMPLERENVHKCICVCVCVYVVDLPCNRICELASLSFSRRYPPKKSYLRTKLSAIWHDIASDIYSEIEDAMSEFLNRGNIIWFVSQSSKIYATNAPIFTKTPFLIDSSNIIIDNELLTRPSVCSIGSIVLSSTFYSLRLDIYVCLGCQSLSSLQREGGRG